MAAPHPMHLPWAARWSIYQRRRRRRADRWMPTTWRMRWMDLIFLVRG